MVNNYIISALPVTMVEFMWNRLVPFIESALSKAPDEETLDNLKENALNGSTLLVIVSKGEEIMSVLTMEVREFPSGMKALYLPVIGGTDLLGWIDQFLSVADAIARDFGCKEVRGMAARKGWMKVIQSRGFEESYVIVKKKVEGVK